MQDPNMRDASCPDKMNLLCIRRIVSILCILYRHLDLLHRCTPPPETPWTEPEPIQDYHVQASMESFFKHSMHADLPPAARLLYRQDFPGFYHCVSQAVYFHYPSYERRQQPELDVIRTGTRHVNALSPLLEMYPEIELCYEDETPAEGKWTWMLMCNRVYMVNGEHVWFDESVVRVLGACLAMK